MKMHKVWRVTSDSGVINTHNRFSRRDLRMYRNTPGYKVERVFVLR